LRALRQSTFLQHRISSPINFVNVMFWQHKFKIHNFVQSGQCVRMKELFPYLHRI
jgi:hypothetical protein